MNILRKNQIIIYTFSLMLVVAGYLNYTNNIKNNNIETSAQTVIEEKDGIEEIKEEKEHEEVETIKENDKTADIGDATLVSSNDVVEVEDYFVKSKLERDTMYSQMISTYEKILDSNNSNEAQKQMSTQEITKITEEKNAIMICENLIKTKGFDNNVVFVNDGSVSIIIGSKEILKQEEIAQIQNIISRELKVNIENIHISTK